MDTIDPRTWMILTVVAVLALIALAAWLFFQKKQSHSLQQRFGPEYGRTIGKLGSRTKADSQTRRLGDAVVP